MEDSELSDWLAGDIVVCSQCSGQTVVIAELHGGRARCGGAVCSA